MASLSIWGTYIKKDRWHLSQFEVCRDDLSGTQRVQVPTMAGFWFQTPNPPSWLLELEALGIGYLDSLGQDVQIAWSVELGSLDTPGWATRPYRSTSGPR